MFKTRKIIFSLFLVLVFLLPAFAQAETQEEFDLKCNTKTASSCEVHDAISPEGPIIANIPAGTHVLVDGRGGENWRLIQFYYNGTKMKGWANVAVVPASSIVRIGEWAHTVNEIDPDYDEKMAQGTVERDVRAGWTTYLYDYDGSEGDLEKVSKEEAEQRSTAYTTGDTADHTQETAASGDTAEVQSTASAPAAGDTALSTREAATSGDATEVQSDASASAVSVEILTLGTAESTIRYDGQERTVKTSELDFSAKDVPAEKAVAVVYAPRTGEASLRAKASTSSKVLRKCKAGTVVSVLEIKGKFSLVNMQGEIGYMRNDCLQYSSATRETMGTALLSYDGQTNGSIAINVRNDTNGSSAKVAEWKTGTEVTVFASEDGWVEVETDGIHGWVMEEYVTMEE